MFEPDRGGFNNIRMAMETVLALAFAMGRTLVLPPAKQMYLLGKKQTQQQGESRPQFSFANFFDMPAIHAEHNGLDIITTDEFLKRITNATKDNSDLTTAAHVKFKQMIPTNHRMNWDGAGDDWFHHVRKHAKNLIWDPEKCFAYFPAESHHNVESMKQFFEDMVAQTTREAKNKRQEAWEKFVGIPTPLNASESYRIEEFAAGRETLCLYSPELQEEPILHFPTTMETAGDATKQNGWSARLLVHFYAFLFFADIHQELWMKRFVRDHVRYTDEIQCAAARVVKSLRDKVQKLHGKPNGQFHSMHVRRGDFQYKKTRVSAQELLKQIQDIFQDGDVLFIATDERKKSFFQPLAKHYTLYFLDDFVGSALGPEINTNYYGMIDQLVASRGKLFFGCWFSTFTSYINRLRGYHSQRNQEPGYENGELRTSFYYAPPDRRNHMLTYYPLKKTFYSREYPTAWRLLNRDLKEKNQEEEEEEERLSSSSSSSLTTTTTTTTSTNNVGVLKRGKRTKKIEAQ